MTVIPQKQTQVIPKGKFMIEIAQEIKKLTYH